MALPGFFGVSASFVLASAKKHTLNATENKFLEEFLL
jgi:hypothetical protein